MLILTSQVEQEVNIVGGTKNWIVNDSTFIIMYCKHYIQKSRYTTSLFILYIQYVMEFINIYYLFHMVQ